MELNLQHEDLLIQLRAMLNQTKIKLWEAPYYDENVETTESFNNLVSTMAETIKVSHEDIIAGLKELQRVSLDRISAVCQFNMSGVATVRIKTPDRSILTCETMLGSPGKVLIDFVATSLNVSEGRIKLIFNGKLVQSDVNLDTQNVKNGSMIMALVMTESCEKIAKEDSMYMEMKAIKEDAELLSTVNDHLGEEYMKVEDQFGRPVSVTSHSRKSLMIAMALHARGKAALNEQKYALALVLLIEADQHFSECEDSLLSVVDNYGVLQLDIAWCYLCLQNLSAATDASRRLTIAEDAFKRSYGEHMERLISVKGSHANERVLMMRLHLLKGIVYYHQNKRDEAMDLFVKVETEINLLRVDETSVTHLMEMGWSRMESISALRASNGDVTQAFNTLQTNAENKTAKLEKEQQERQNRAKYGSCSDGTAVDPKFVSMLTEMGYSKKLSTAALKRTNNIVEQAIEMIHTGQIDESSLSSQESLSLDQVDEKLTEELLKMGFNVEDARKALCKSKNVLSNAIDFLSKMDGPSTSQGRAIKKMKKFEKSEEALKRLTQSLTGDENEHLNTDLQQEEEFLVQYKSLL